MNYSDTERIRYLMRINGFRETRSSDEADVVILNTCSVRQRAEDKVLGLARKMSREKLKSPGKRILLTGCMAERLTRCGKNREINLGYLRKMRKKMPWIDEFVGIGDVAKLGEVLSLKNCNDTIGKQQDYSSRVSAFVPISSGCDNFCSYCVVPYSRGREVHRSYQEIFEQVRDLVEKRYRFITLLGQNVNSWKGRIDGKRAAFPELLSQVDRIEGNYWVTFLTSHPKDMSSALIDVMANGIHVSRYLNLPAQSGSNKVLNLMNRKYTREDYERKIEVIKDRIPGIRLSTDIIVGFPGETNEDFLYTRELLEKVRYGMAYISEFSPREYSVAASLKETVSAKEKSERKKILENVQRKIMKEENRKFIGAHVRVLVNGRGKGILSDLREVTFSREAPCKEGSFMDAVVTDFSASGLRVSFDV